MSVNAIYQQLRSNPTCLNYCSAAVQLTSIHPWTEIMSRSFTVPPRELLQSSFVRRYAVACAPSPSE